MTGPALHLPALRKLFGSRLQTDVSLKRYTAARLGGQADVLITARTVNELSDIVIALWEGSVPFVVLGSGSNVLVADAGVRQVIVLNRARKVIFDTHSEPHSVWVESGASMVSVARRAAALGQAGMEWAAGIPGTIGGAIYGNAGAHGSDMSRCLLMAEILHLNQTGAAQKHTVLREQWAPDRFEFAYRSSLVKRQPGRVVILSAQLKLADATPAAVKAKMEEYRSVRQASQPTGASLGSIFKNPTGDYAGRLIEVAGLKGSKVGKVEISHKHANFFTCQDSASASDYAALIRLAQQKVFENSGVRLELEIELLGDWTGQG